jgi:hypothetical protein
MLFFMSVRLKVHVSARFFFSSYSLLMAMIFSLATSSSLLSCSVACSTMVVVENAAPRQAVVAG